MTRTQRRRLRVFGVVQGVGFRPFVARVAEESGLAGFVRNETGEVTIEVEGAAQAVASAVERILDEAPPMARIERIEQSDIDSVGERGFVIGPSGHGPSDATRLPTPPDLATCDACRAELFDPRNRRYRHPFITCTECGPRNTVVTSLPYDRERTTMADFAMCAACESEYADPRDRRHHAQILSCPQCGPTLSYDGRERSPVDHDAVVASVQHDLSEGRIVALKGVGGYHLAVDAFDEIAVRRLRERKGRPDKPFAVMVPDLASARRLAHVGDAEAAALRSPCRPIVVLPTRRPAALVDSIAPGSDLLGLMLAYAPLHHLLFEPVPGSGARPPVALVMTSGNPAGEPICADDVEARHRLAGIADSFCAHDRRIQVRCDDSVTRIVDGAELPLRLGRGRAPMAIDLPHDVAPTLALGGDVKNAICVADGRRALVSQHLGDVESLAGSELLEDTAARLVERLGAEDPTIAVDAHPGYRTRHLGRRLSRTGRPREVGHHHAHLASLMAEHGLSGDEPVLGFAFDGTGYGIDGTLWGGEVLVADYTTCERRTHLAEVRMPGGESAVRRPYRMALAHLSAAGIPWSDDLSCVSMCGHDEIAVLRRQISRGIGSPLTSSMGRLFDAMAALLGLCQETSYEAQAPIALEELAGRAARSVAPLSFGTTAEGMIDPAPLWAETIERLRSGTPLADLAAAFHGAVVDLIERWALAIRDERGVDVVGLTGGVFQNALLTSAAVPRLAGRGFTVLTHRRMPPNDGGLALGQVMVAAGRAERVAGDARGAAVCV